LNRHEDEKDDDDSLNDREGRGTDLKHEEDEEELVIPILLWEG
jgi:hypothetical protein